MTTVQELIDIYRGLGEKIKGVEIGVESGGNSSSLLNSLPNMELLVSVDPYVIYHDWDAAANKARIGKKDADDKYKGAQSVLSPYGNRSLFLREFSAAAAKSFPENNFDFIYIDGDHTYNGVMCDLLSWYPKIRNGGIISGHDWGWQTTGVQSAVTDWVHNYGHPITQEDIKVISGLCWYIIKK